MLEVWRRKVSVQITGSVLKLRLKPQHVTGIANVGENMNIRLESPKTRWTRNCWMVLSGPIRKSSIDPS